jgi:hypothetical protein
MNILEMEAFHYFHGHVNFMLHMPQISISHILVCSINITHVALFQVLWLGLTLTTSIPTFMLFGLVL